MIYIVVLASASQQSGSVIRVHASTLLEILFPCKSLQRAEQEVLISSVCVSSCLPLYPCPLAPLSHVAFILLLAKVQKCSPHPSFFSGRRNQKQRVSDGWGSRGGRDRKSRSARVAAKVRAQGLLGGGRRGEAALHTSPEVSLT